MSVEMLDRVYGHHHPDHLRTAARALGSAGGANHWPKHWPCAAPAVLIRGNALKALVGREKYHPHAISIVYGKVRANRTL